MTTDTVLKVDCDTYVERGLLELNPLQNHAGDRKIFRYGDYRSAKDENEIHINGCIMARMDTLRAVNMYDERLQQYGWDDSNLYDRLRDSGAQDLNITRRNAAGPPYITHVWHPHSEMSQDARVGASCVNRCAVNRLERYNPWKNQQRAEYNEIAEAPPNIPSSITFHSYRGGSLPSVLDILGKETADLLATYCKNSQYAGGEVLRVERLERRLGLQGGARHGQGCSMGDGEAQGDVSGGGRRRANEDPFLWGGDGDRKRLSSARVGDAT